MRPRVAHAARPACALSTLLGRAEQGGAGAEAARRRRAWRRQTSQSWRT